jgi:hypothetical protein
VSARDELLAGQLGPAAATALYRSVRITAFAHNFPPPPGNTVWDDDAVEAVAHDFLTGSKGLARLTEIALRTTDERSFARLLDAAVLNHHRDVARRTDLGRLIRRLKEVLNDSDRFARAPQGQGWWHHVDHPGGASTVPQSQLAANLLDVMVVVPKWDSETRERPIADRDSLERLLENALTTAQGALTEADLAKLVAGRVETRRSPVTIELDLLEGTSEPAADLPDAVDTQIHAQHAKAILDRLSDVQRIILVVADDPVREIATVLGVGKTKAAQQRQRLFDFLQGQLADADDPASVLSELSNLCTGWFEQRTQTLGATSKKDYADGDEA